MESSTVLIVDDDPEIAKLYGFWLRDDYEVKLAYDGDETLELLDESVAVVLLDRRMPGLTGDDVLIQIRERNYDCYVVMVTAVKPDFDVLEMPFDEYIRKPVSKGELLESVARMECLSGYDRGFREYYSLLSKKAALDTEKTDRELEQSPKYTALVREIEEKRAQLDRNVKGLQTADVDLLFRP